MELIASPAFDIINSNNETNLPDGIKGGIEHSNNCLAIQIFNERLFIAWRSSHTHFASNYTKIFLMSAELTNTENLTADQHFDWVKEDEIQLGSDAREPYFVIVNDTLHFYFFQAGNDPIAF